MLAWRGVMMNMPSRWTMLLLATGLLTPAAVRGQTGADDAALAPEVYEALPVREVTIFKDGHAFMLHAGTLPTNAAGNVELDRLPRPVLGTFWPYAAGGARLTGVVAARRRVAVERTALNLVDLLRANVGNRAAVTVTTARDRTELIEGTISDFPQRSADEQQQFYAGQSEGAAGAGQLPARTDPAGGVTLPAGSDRQCLGRWTFDQRQCLRQRAHAGSNRVGDLVDAILLAVVVGVAERPGTRVLGGDAGTRPDGRIGIRVALLLGLRETLPGTTAAIVA